MSGHCMIKNNNRKLIIAAFPNAYYFRVAEFKPFTVYPKVLYRSLAYLVPKTQKGNLMDS